MQKKFANNLDPQTLKVPIWGDKYLPLLRKSKCSEKTQKKSFGGNFSEGNKCTTEKHCTWGVNKHLKIWVCHQFGAKNHLPLNVNFLICKMQKRGLCYLNGSPCVHGAASQSPRRSLKVPTESETLGGGPAICVLTSPPGDSDVHSSFRTTKLNDLKSL